MYLSTEFRKYNSNILGSICQGSHPIAFAIDGVEYDCDTEARINALESGKKNGSFCELCSDPRIEFKVTSEWQNDCDTNGFKIRWRVPVGAVAIYE